MKQAHQSAIAISEAATVPPTGVFYGWWVAAASFVCLMVGINPIANLTFGVFFPALSQEFGWSRSQAAHGVSLAMLGFTLMQPLTGKLITRYGAKQKGGALHWKVSPGENVAGRVVLVLDDILVNFDPDRTRATLRVLARLARKHQIIAFTCHPQLRELFRKEGARVVVGGEVVDIGRAGARSDRRDGRSLPTALPTGRTTGR